MLLELFCFIAERSKVTLESQSQKRRESGGAELPKVPWLLDGRAGALALACGLGSTPSLVGQLRREASEGPRVKR